MGRPFVLAEERGMLWLPYDQTGEGLLFAFKSADLPQGVKAHPILDESKSVDKAEEHTVYRVSSGDDLRKAFGVAVAPLDDPRTSKTYEAPVYYYPDWAKE
jgi:hypothetical protein